MSFVPQPTEVLLQNVRVSYCHLLEPWANSTQPGAKPRYSATILLPKTDVAQHQALMNAIEAAIQSARTKFGARVPAQPKVPIHDGDGYTQSGKEFGPECKGHWVFTAAQDANYKVEVVDLLQILRKYIPACMSMYSFDSSSTPINPLVSDVVWALFKKYAMVKRWAACLLQHPLYLVHLKVVRLMFIPVLQWQQVNLCNNKPLNRVMYNRHMLRHLSNLYNRLL